MIAILLTFPCFTRNPQQTIFLLCSYSHEPDYLGCISLSCSQSLFLFQLKKLYRLYRLWSFSAFITSSYSTYFSFSLMNSQPVFTFIYHRGAGVGASGHVVCPDTAEHRTNVSIQSRCCLGRAGGHLVEAR